MDIKVGINKKSFISCAAKCASFWLRHQTVVLMVFLAIALGAGGYVWYKSAYGSSWSDEKKQEFMRSKDTSVKLKENVVDRTLQEIDARAQRFENTEGVSKNIFNP